MDPLNAAVAMVVFAGAFASAVFYAGVLVDWMLTRSRLDADWKS